MPEHDEGWRSIPPPQPTIYGLSSKKLYKKALGQTNAFFLSEVHDRTSQSVTLTP